MTSSRASRLNARLSPVVASKVAYLRKRTKRTTTEIVVESINRYHAEIQRQGEGAAEILRESGFIGCAEGPQDLSERYKSELTKSLRKKT